MDNLNIVGIKEISDIAKKEENAQNLTMIVDKKNQEELKNLEETAFEKPKPKPDVKPTLQDVEITNPKIKKKRGRPRGVSKKDPEQMKEHMRLMREKAKISKARKKQERQQKKEELQSLKLAKKMGISMESLLEYEQKRKLIQQGKKYLDNQRKEIEEPIQIIQKKQPSQHQFSNAKDLFEKNEPVDYDKIADLVFNRFKTHEENKRQQKIQQQEHERLRIQQLKDKNQERLYQQNARYYKRLGKPNMNKRKDDDDAWVSLFRKKR